MNIYQLETQVLLTMRFFQADGVTPADPSTVTLRILTPDGAVASYSYAGGDIVRVSAGVYTYQLETTQSGRWLYKWQGDGSLEVASPDITFLVAPSAVLAG